jgi:hypothetical protein
VISHTHFADQDRCLEGAREQQRRPLVFDLDPSLLKDAFQGRKGAAALVKTIAGSPDANRDETAQRLTQVIIDVQAKTMDAQNQLAEAKEKIRSLQQRIKDMDTWATEKQRYELWEAGSGRALVYRLKESERAGQPEHFICPKCYEDGQARILQRHKAPGLEWLTCLTCDARLYVHGVSPGG